MPLHVDFDLLEVCLTVYLGRALLVWGEIHLLGRVEGRVARLQRREGVVLEEVSVPLSFKTRTCRIQSDPSALADLSWDSLWMDLAELWRASVRGY